MRDADTSWFGQFFESSSYVHPSAVEIVSFGDDIPQVNANAVLHPCVLGGGGIALRDLVLDLDGEANSLNNAGELSDEAVPCAAEDVTAMSDDQLFHHSSVHAQNSCGGFFVKLRKVAVPRHIGSENRSKPTFHGQNRSKQRRKKRTTYGRSTAVQRPYEISFTSSANAPDRADVRHGSLTDITCAGQGCPLFSWNQSLARRQGGGIVVRNCAGEAILAHLATLPPGVRFTPHVGLAHDLSAHAPSFGGMTFPSLILSTASSIAWRGTRNNSRGTIGFPKRSLNARVPTHSISS